MVKIRKPCGDDAVHLANNLRAADRAELELMTDLDPLRAILVSMEVTEYKHLWCAEDEDGVFCIGGCSIDGAPWLLATDRLEKYSVLLTKVVIKKIVEMHKDYDELTNYVDARNLASVRWLTRLGFEFEPLNNPLILRFSRCRRSGAM